MTRNEKYDRRRRRERRDFLRGFPLTLFDGPGLAVKLPFAALYPLGAVWVWNQQEQAVALAQGSDLISPVLRLILENIFPAYLIIGGAALLILLCYPIGRKAAEEELKRQQEEAARQAAAAARQQAASNRNNSSSSSSNSSSNSNKGNSSHKGTSNNAPSYVSGDAVSRAYSALGKPYVWGATGPNSFDCSGLVGFCLTGRYSRSCTSASLNALPTVSNPQPGDVCVRSGHCGIYIGNGQMIHAPHTGDVVKVASVPSNMRIVRP